MVGSSVQEHRRPGQAAATCYSPFWVLDCTRRHQPWPRPVHAPKPAPTPWPLQAKEDLARHQQVVAFLKQEYTRVSTSNVELPQRVAVLERLPVLSYSHPSACVVRLGRCAVLS